MKAPIFPSLGKKVKDITSFCGEHFGKLCDGQLKDSNNVTVITGGALSSLLSERKIDIMKNAHPLTDGVFTLNAEYDPSYETPVTLSWIYNIVCPEDVMAYKEWEIVSSRVFIKDIGESGKSADGYRRILGAYSDGVCTYVVYEASYMMIDQRRSSEMTRYPRGYVVQLRSGSYGGMVGSTIVYSLSQLLLDTIDPYGNVTTDLLDVQRVLREKITYVKYEDATLISIDGVNYRYASYDYTPSVGETYTFSFDWIYTDVYPTLGDYSKVEFQYSYPKRTVRYSNVLSGTAPFDTSGDKLLLLPDMRLMIRSNGKWSLSSKNEEMPTLTSAVQYLDRLFGIYGNVVFASVAGKCTDFKQPPEETKTGGWRMVTADAGGFTAITSFGGKVVVFTSSSMMTVRGSELPFTLSYVGDYGCVSDEAVSALDGLLYFVSRDGVMCYNGSSVKKISSPLPRETDFSSAVLSADSGMLVLSVRDGSLWFYEPQSGEWCRRIFDADDITLLKGTAIVKKDNGNLVYRLFDEFGDFSFSVALANGGRRKIKSISVTASTGIDSELTLVDEKGKALMCIYDTEGEIVTRTFLPRGLYIDSGKINFEGRGECTLYGLKIEYASLLSASKRRE